MTRSGALALLCLTLLATTAPAQCPPSCAVRGGGSLRTDCLAEFAGQGNRYNYPSFDPGKPRAAREVRCFDGDAACDLDGQVNNSCQFDVDVCLRNDDPNLPTCVPGDISLAKVGKTSDPQLAALQAALDGLLPATTNVCTTGSTVTVPLLGPDRKGLYKRARKSVRLKVSTATKQRDGDTLRLVCVPREWPSHGYDAANHRFSPRETVLSPSNAAQLQLKWLFPIGDDLNNGVTATPTVGDGLVYVSSWSGNVYGIGAVDGLLRWTYDTHVVNSLGVQSTPTLTADGRLVFGDADGTLHCLRAKNGKPLWTNHVGGAIDHFWASAQVVGNRGFIGTASHSDSPCAPGYFYSFDVDTGQILWSRRTVPDFVCHNDTTISCSTDADCGGTPGSCVAGCGAGVTATAAVSPDGATVYMTTVGSYTYPSIGDSETIFALDAATGSVLWKYRTQPGEQFADGPPYHDWGFVNGPMLIDGDNGSGGTRPLVVAAGKEGTLYALDPATGTPVWTRALITPLPDFAGFGLFNGAIGWTGHRIIAALYTPGASWPVTNDHLFGFNDLDGSTAWSAQIGNSWAHVALANGLVFAGNNQTGDLYVHNATTGAHLKTLTLPTTSSSGASIVNGWVYVGYGVFGINGGVAAFGLP